MSAFEIKKDRVYGNFKTPLGSRKRRKTPKEKRPGNDPAYLALIRQLPCCTCGMGPPSQCHHLKSTGERGGGMRSSDKWAVPMCNECHINGVERHGSKKEDWWFRGKGIEDTQSLAAALYANRHSLESMFSVLEANTQKIR